MEKYVYKITNTVNGKIYIGQTNDLKRRMQEHKHDNRQKSYLHRAIKKYGWDKFLVDVLYFGENYNEEEKKWIKRYDSRNKEKGYNIVEGGQDSFGENNPASVLNQIQADEVIQLLQFSDKNCNEIADITNVSLKNIYNINSGVAWKKYGISYPIKNLINRLSEDTINTIYDLLINTELSYEEIAELYNIQSYIICSINLGKVYKKNKYQYPLRDVHKKQKETVKKIIELLSKTDLSFKEIEKITGKTTSVIYRINQGKSWFDEKITYPIRSNK